MMRRLLSATIAAALLCTVPCCAPAFAGTSFSPIDGSTVNINVSSSSQSVLVSNLGSGQQVRVENDGSATVWIRAGDSTVTATTSNIPIPSGDIEVFTFNPKGPLYIAAIAAGSTGKVYFTPGAGI